MGFYAEAVSATADVPLLFMRIYGRNRSPVAASAIANDPTRLNAIVLFTDGVPNGLTAWFNDPNNNALSATSRCTYNPSPDRSPPIPPTQPSGTKSIVGWMAASGSSQNLAFFD